MNPCGPTSPGCACRGSARASSRWRRGSIPGMSAPVTSRCTTFVAEAPWDATAMLRVARDWVLGPLVRHGPAARQALTVALARCIQVGEEGMPGDQRTRAAQSRRKRRTFSQNHCFEAVAVKWSRTFNAVAEDGRPGLVPTTKISMFRHDDALEVRRQLLAVGVRVGDLWKIIAGDWSKEASTNPFFYLTRPNPKLGFRVHLRNTAQLEELRRLLPPSPEQSRRLLFDTDPWPHRVDRYSICAERPFNGVEENETIVALLETMERTRLQFHARCFLADYWQWARTVERVEQWKRRIPYKRRMRFAR